MKKERINVNNIDGNIQAITEMLRVTNEHWINEINSDGENFNYDSQDIYCHFVQNISNFNLNEKINPENNKEERNVLIDNLRTEIFNNIKLYNNFHFLFEDYPRNKILIQELRLRKYPKTTKSDEEIFENFIRIKEIQSRSRYFNSDLYKNFGFLEHNFHEEIYNYCCFIKDQINDGIINIHKYDFNYLNIHDKPFFNMGIIHHIHKNYSGILFEEISELKLYNSLNLQNTVQHLKIKNSERGFYLIHNLKELVPIILQESWLKGILNEIDKSKKHYKSKYRIVAGSNITSDQKNFKEELDTIFKDIIIPLVS